jgi:hypothetical protein
MVHEETRIAFRRSWIDKQLKGKWSLGIWVYTDRPFSNYVLANSANISEIERTKWISMDQQ